MCYLVAALSLTLGLEGKVELRPPENFGESGKGLQIRFDSIHRQKKILKHCIIPFPCPHYQGHFEEARFRVTLAGLLRMDRSFGIPCRLLVRP
jgi:hypothetical protein